MKRRLNSIGLLFCCDQNQLNEIRKIIVNVESKEIKTEEEPTETNNIL